MRKDGWKLVQKRFSGFVCIDSCRDEHDITLNEYTLKLVDAMDQSKPPYVIVAHSFGAYLAEACLDKLKVSPLAIVFLSGIAANTSNSVLECYQDSGQTLLIDNCRLDYSSGVLRLKDKDYYRSLLGSKNDFEIQIADVEPGSFIIESPMNASEAAHAERVYLASRDDEVTSFTRQCVAAEILAAKLIECQGGHLAGLINPALWISEVHAMVERRTAALHGLPRRS
jgi:predicted alpha/beta hydrolase family esterase